MASRFLDAQAYYMQLQPDLDMLYGYMGALHLHSSHILLWSLYLLYDVIIQTIDSLKLILDHELKFNSSSKS